MLKSKIFKELGIISTRKGNRAEENSLNQRGSLTPFIISFQTLDQAVHTE